MLSDGRASAIKTLALNKSQCPLEHCMLSDHFGDVRIRARAFRLNALSSIVCFLTNTRASGLASHAEGESQCPLEHCMLSDFSRDALAGISNANGLNALSSIVCFLTLEALAGMINGTTSQCPLEHCMLSDLCSCYRLYNGEQKVSMPSRALYAF